MDASVQYFEVAKLHTQLTDLLQMIAATMEFYDSRTRAMCDAIIYCLNDLELAMISRTHSYPDFSESAYKAAQSYELNRHWFAQARQD